MMRTATHNSSEAREYAAQLLAVVGEPHAQTLHFCKWIAARLEWERSGVLEALRAGEPVRGFNPGDSESIDAWAN